MDEVIQKVGLIASVILPFFNLPLIVHILRRKSSSDISMVWAVGIWSCILLMTPAALRSSDPVFRIFGIFNLILFSGVFAAVLKYRNRPPQA